MTIHEAEVSFSPISYLRTKKYPPRDWWLSGGIAATNCVAAYQPKGAASLEASYVNLCNPGTYDATHPEGNPAWDSTNGWKFNGSVALQSAPHALNMTAIIRFSGAGQGALFGLEDKWEVWARYGGLGVYYVSGSSQTISPIITSGVLALSKTTGFRNGVIDVATLTGNSATWLIGIGGRTRSDGVLSFKAPYNCQAFALYNDNLTESQIASLTTAMNAL